MRGVAGRRRVGEGGLIVAEIAMAVVLTFGAGLAARSVAKLVSTGVGYPTDRLLTFRVDLPRGRYDDVPTRDAFGRALVARIATEPSLEGSFIWRPNDVGLWGWVAFLHPDVPAATPSDRVMVTRHTMSVGALDVMGIPLAEGRTFGSQDDLDGDPVVVVSEDLARRFWPGEDAVGRSVYWSGRERALTVVGVARNVDHGPRFDVRYGAHEFEPKLDVYLPMAQEAVGNLAVGVRTRGDPRAALAAVRRALSAVDPTLAMYGVTTVEERMRAEEGPSRAIALLLSLYAVAALVLAAVGAYGVLSHRAARSLPEVGVRLVFGASPTAMARRLVAEAVRPALVGSVVGVAASVVAGRAFSSVLFGVSPYAPGLLIAVSLLLLAVAVMASVGPAGRVARLHPRSVLSSD